MGLNANKLVRMIMCMLSKSNYNNPIGCFSPMTRQEFPISPFDAFNRKKNISKSIVCISHRETYSIQLQQQMYDLSEKPPQNI